MDLIDAVRKGDIQETTRLIDSYGRRYSFDGSEGYNLLMIALENNNSAIAELLISRGCSVKRCSGPLLLGSEAQIDSIGPGGTPLYLITERDDPLKCSANASSTDRGSVELNTLRNESSDVNASTKTTHTVTHGSIFGVPLKYNTNVNPADEKGVTPLHISVQHGNPEITTLLLDKGAYVNAKECKRNETPLHIAVIAGHMEIIKLLLESGADVNSEDVYCRTPLHLAAERDHPSFKHKANASSIDGLHASDGSELISYVLLRYNANVNLADEKGVTLLHISVKNRNVELSSLLLDMGAEVNAQKNNGDTALILAAASGNEKMVRLLLDRRAHVNHKGKYMRSPLHWAAENNNTEIIDVLLEFGAEVDSRCENGATALHYSSQLGAVKTITKLIEYGADVNIVCKWFHTPLDSATNVLHLYGRHLPCEDTVHFLNQHHVKMEIAGLVAPGFWPSVSEREGGLEDFRFECQLELARTKSVFIENTNVSYYDIVRKDVRCVAKYMNNPSVMVAAESEDYRETFPLYASLIKSQFRKGLKSVKLLESSQVIHRLTGLPDVCIQQILDRLSVDDLKILMEV